MTAPQRARRAMVFWLLAFLAGGSVLVYLGSLERGGPGAGARTDDPILPGEGAPDGVAAEVRPSQDSMRETPGRYIVPEGPAPDDPGHGAVEVEVSHEDGGPARRINVRLLLEKDGERICRIESTDDHGVVVFDVESGATIRSVKALATAETTPNSRWLDRISRHGTTLHVSLRVSAGWPVSGIVVGAADVPVPGADVFAWCADGSEGEPDRVTTTDRYGAFHLEHLGPRFRIIARSAGLACSTGLRGTLSPAASAEGLRIELVPEKRLRGRVLDATGAPVAGARVWVDGNRLQVSERDMTHVEGVLTFKAGEAATRTNESGAFELSGLSQEVHLVLVERPPYLVFRGWLETGEEMHEITLDPGLSLRGRVLDARGAPAAGARVMFWPFASDVQSVPREVKCDEDGLFLLTCMAAPGMEASGTPGGAAMEGGEPPPFAIGVLFQGHAVEVVQPVRPNRSGGEFVEVRLREERVIAGRTVDRSGAPLPGVRVQVEGERELETGVNWGRRNTWEFCAGIADTESDGLGRFRFDKLYDGNYVLRATLPGVPNEVMSMETPAGYEDVRFMLEADEPSGVALTGKVTDKLTGLAVTDFTLLPLVDGTGLVRDFHSAQGRFNVSGLPAGEIQVVIRAAGYTSHWVEPRNYEQGLHSLDVELVPSRSLRLKVVDKHGVPLDKGRVQAFDLSGRVLTLEGAESMLDHADIVEGEALLHGLPAAVILLRITAFTSPGECRQDEVVDVASSTAGSTHEVVLRDPDY